VNGHAVTYESPFWHVPKRDLAGAVQATLQGRRLLIAPGLKDASAIKRELSTFQVRINKETGHESLESIGKDHDDLVLACALAVWFGERCQRELRVEMFGWG
jgi:hypothetical protein